MTILDNETKTNGRTKITGVRENTASRCYKNTLPSKLFKQEFRYEGQKVVFCCTDFIIWVRCILKYERLGSAVHS